MAQDIRALGPLVRARREELGLSQEDLAAIGGPSTTTVSKIENGEAKAIRHRTALDLDRALGWRMGSTEDVLYGVAAPKVVSQPDATYTAPQDQGKAPVVAEDPAGPMGDEWMTVRAERDTRGERVIVGVSVFVDPEGVQSRAELRYWPGDATRVVSMPGFGEALGEAHRIALDYTSAYRAAKEVGDRERSAAMNEAGETPAADNVRPFRRADERDDETGTTVPVQERAVANEDDTLEDEGIAQLEDP